MLPIPGLQRTADGRIVSWAQNAEDIMLLRMFGRRRHGTWIDVGANHPSHDSVTRNFYDAGWRGINVEPLDRFFTLLVQQRPEDVNLQCVASDRAGTTTFYRDDSNPDWSTLMPDMAAAGRSGGHEIVEMEVRMRTLADICREHLEAGQRIDFLKVDVEGHEIPVLEGHDFDRNRPVVVVVEVRAAYSAALDALMRQRGYERRWFDGTNNWYLHSLHAHELPDDVWRPAYPVLDNYHPWLYVLQEAHPAWKLTADGRGGRTRGQWPGASAVRRWLGSGPTADPARPTHALAADATAAPPPQQSDPPAGAASFLISRHARDPRSFIATVDPADDMLGHGRQYFGDGDVATLTYFRHGFRMLSDFRQIVDWRFGGFDGVGSLLEFAAGFGRMTRWLVQELPPARIRVSDIDERAVAFLDRTFGVGGFVSAADPARIACDERFDLIVVASLFSHLPQSRFRPMLERLFSLLAPDGLLVFTVHDELFLTGQPMPAEGIAFIPHSESQSLSTADYGTTFVTERFVADAIAAVAGDGWPYRRLPRGLCGHQDIYVVPRDRSCAVADMPFRNGPEGCFETCEPLSGQVLRLAGWAGDPDPDRTVEEVRVLLDGHVVQRCRPTLPRPDVVATLREPRHATAGWQCIVGTAGGDPTLEITAVADDGREHVLSASRLGAVVGRRLC